jgi:hypothetical protein
VCIGFAKIVMIPLAMILLATPAKADDTVLIVSGAAPRHAREVATNALAIASDLAGSKIITSPFLVHEETAVAKCMADSKPWVCMNPMLRGKNIQQLAVLSLDNQTNPDGSPVIVITEQVVTGAQFAPAGDKRFCEHCTDDVLARLATELTRDLLREVAARSGRTVIAIHTVPRGAEIVLDGKPIGVTDQSINTYPGTHSLQLTLDGYQASSRTVDTGEGKTTEVQVQLTKPGATAPDHGEPSVAASTPEVTGLAALPRWVPWTGIGVGVAAAGVGVALQVTKDSPPKGEHQPAHLVSVPGIALMAGGGAVAIASALLWVHIARSTPPSSAPNIALMAGGGIIEWTGRF